MISKRRKVLSPIFEVAPSDDAWKAINDGLQEAKSVYERAWKKVSEAITRIR